MKPFWKSTRFTTGQHLTGAMAFVACGASLYAAQPAHAGLFSMSEEDEINAGKQVAVQAEKEYGGVLPDNDPMVQRVRAIGYQFAHLSSRKSIPFSYNVLRSDTVLNAFAAPGGPVFVTKKLVETTSNDAELAYVLGHETTHIERRHVVIAAQKQQELGIGIGILGAILGSGKSGSAIGTISNVGLTLWSKGFSRKDENEADAGGVRWMSQLGYDPRAAVTMLGKLGDGPENPLSRALADHPASSQREQTVGHIIQTENLLDVSRRNGGPRLGANLNFNSRNNYSPNYGNTYHPGNAGALPPTDNSGAVYVPPANNRGSRDGSYPNYGGQSLDSNNTPTNTPTAMGGEIDLGAPLMMANTNDGQVIMAPVRGMARWAGAQNMTSGNVTTLRRGNAWLRMTRRSTTVNSGGQISSLSVAPDIYNGLLYAPIGILAEGVGATARVDGNTNLVWLVLDNNHRGFLRLPQ